MARKHPIEEHLRQRAGIFVYYRRIGGQRDKIQENEEIYVWAEAKSGLRSEYLPVKVGWDFVE